ncbi:MAG: hypothetical protein QXK30_01630 [Candidatus Bathyarchaeia archaeon]
MTDSRPNDTISWRDIAELKERISALEGLTEGLSGSINDLKKEVRTLKAQNNRLLISLIIAIITTLLNTILGRLF